MNNCFRIRHDGRWLSRRCQLLSVLLSISMGAQADRIDIRGLVVDAQHQPIAHLPLRLVLDSDDDPHAPQAGHHLVSDGDGRFALQVDRTPRRRWVYGGSLGMVLPIPARATVLGLGIEAERFGRKRLDWLHINWMSVNAATQSDAYAQGANGRFDVAYRSDLRAGDFFVDRPDQRFSGLGTPLVLESINQHPRPEGGIHWHLELKVIHSHTEPAESP